MLKIIPLGGLGEIGLNMMVVEHNDIRFIIDAGLMFPEDYMLGVDIVIPDIQYLKDKKNTVSGIILTHAHEDHIGALPYLLRDIKAPVFGTALTLGMVKTRLAEFDLLQSVPLHTIAPGEHLKIGELDIEFIRVGHSVVDGIALSIMTPYGRIIHTGDFKISCAALDDMITDVNRFATLGDEGVLALLSDSTNVEKEGYTISGDEIAKTLQKITAESRGRVIVSLFASNIRRIQRIVDIARMENRKVIFNGRSIENSVAVARELGYLKVPENLEVEISDMKRLRDDEIIMITTGTQGEPMSALARMAAGLHRQIKIKNNDTVIFSSKFIPGNEKAITGMINQLYKAGANVIYEKISAIHVSGHAFREELKLMINLTKPSFFMPIHGEYRHLVLHGRLAESIGIPKKNILLAENGHVIAVDHAGIRIVGKIETGRVLVDGKGVGDVGRSVLKERRILSEHGLVTVMLVFDEETKAVAFGPEIVSKGFVFETETGHLLEDSKCVILEIVDECAPEMPDRINVIRSRVQKALKQYFYFAIGRRPLILPIIIEV